MGSVSVEASGSSEQQTDIGGFGGFMGQGNSPYQHIVVKDRHTLDNGE